ncbi:hypothetical protein A9Q84_00625 [Halobacteriovorax marinus]|uniref:AMIN domain-containing protein n=1 Tax=Halobacteriovorax marinus TaxID=97084 RepID=A0A1Y5FI75_9BACT|nr:hypothetical protein A9Q84_00625 [Halobacteriovorax marinus]
MNLFKLLVVLSLLSFQTVFASETFDYAGQRSEEVNLEVTKEITLHRVEYVDGTCERQVPYQEEVCGNETRYRQECRDVPGHNNCYNQSRQVCEYVTNYRQSCTTGPSRETCRNVTRYRENCTTGPSREVCRDEPARRVCRTRNGVERCRDVPGRRHCTTKPGERTCRRVPYQDRVCRTHPGERTCRSVPYQDRECRDVSERVCDWIPTRNVCDSIPYQEWVCRDVTRYRTETYACKKPINVPYQAEKKFIRNVSFKFTDEAQVGNAKFNLSLNADSSLVVQIINNDKEISYIQSKKKTQLVSDTDEENIVNTVYKINFGHLETFLAPLRTELKSLWMNKAGKFVLKTSGSEALKEASITIDVVKRKNGKRHFNKAFKLSEFTTADSKLSIDLSKHGFSRLKGSFGKAVKLKTQIKISIEAPKHLVDPITQSLFVTKDFKLKVYKNK